MVESQWVPILAGGSWQPLSARPCYHHAGYELILKTRFNLLPFSIAQGAGELVALCKKNEPPVSNILLIAPPFVEATRNKEYQLAFEGAIEKSKSLASHYEFFATKLGCRFFDASKVIKSSSRDGIHLEPEAHMILARKLTDVCRDILKV